MSIDKTFDHPSLEIKKNNLRRAPHTLTHSQANVHNFVQNVYELYIKISYTFQRTPDTQSRVIRKVYDFLGQPLYIF